MKEKLNQRELFHCKRGLMAVDPNLVLLLSACSGLLLALLAFFLPLKAAEGGPDFRSLFGVFLLGALTLPLLPSPEKIALAAVGLLLSLVLGAMQPLPRFCRNLPFWLGILVLVLGGTRFLVPDPVLFSYFAFAMTLGLSALAFFRQDGTESTAAMSALLAAAMVWGSRLGALQGGIPLVLALLVGGFLLLALFLRGGSLPMLGTLVLSGLSGWLLLAFLFEQPRLFGPFLCGLLLVLVLLPLRFLPEGLLPFAMVLFTGATLILVNRLFGIYGVALSGIPLLAFIPGERNGVALLSVFAGRTFLQLFLDRIGLSQMGVDITRVYAFAALALAVLLPFAIASLAQLEDRFLGFLAALFLLMLPGFVGFFAQVDALAAFFGGLVLVALVSYRETRMAPLLLAHSTLALLLAPWCLQVLTLPRQARLFGLLIVALIALLCAFIAFFRSSLRSRPA